MFFAQFGCRMRPQDAADRLAVLVEYLVIVYRLARLVGFRVNTLVLRRSRLALARSTRKVSLA